MTPLPILLPAHPSCTECELHSGARNPGVPSVHLPESLPFSRTTPVVAVLGMNPGLQEDRTNTPFVGPSGRLLRDVYLRDIIPNACVFLLHPLLLPTQAPPLPHLLHHSLLTRPDLHRRRPLSHHATHPPLRRRPCPLHHHQVLLRQALVPDLRLHPAGHTHQLVGGLATLHHLPPSRRAP